MNTQYDGIAAGYQRTKATPVREHVEAFSLMRMLGDVHDKHVLDLACGDGFYTRRIREAGAAVVKGVDISPEMLALANAEEQRAPLGLEYECADVATWVPDRRYDLVSAAYLLHYAPDLSALEKMCRNIAQSLRPGGRLVAINENPAQPATSDAGYTQYGFNKQFTVPRGEGSPIEYSMISGRQLMRFTVWYYSREVYEQALRAAGFQDVRWLPLQLSPLGLESFGEDYWAAYMANPPVTGLEARL